jgi:tight adherence protein B
MVVALLAILAAVSAVGLAVASFRFRPATSAAEERVFALDPQAAQRIHDLDSEISVSASRGFGAGWFAGDRVLLQRAGLEMSPLVFLLLHLVVGLLGFAVVLSFSGSNLGGLVLALLGGAAGAFLPRFLVSWRAKRHAARLELQLIELLSMVATSVRAGFSLMQSLESVSQRLGAPISIGVDGMIADVQLGRQVDEAMRDWAESTGSRDVSLVVTAMLVQRSAGGNLAEVLENLAETMRDRVELRQQLQAITAYPRMTSRVVAVYPFAIVLLLTLMQPETWGMLWNTGVGHVLLGIAVALDTIAFFALRRISQLDF